MTCSTNSASSCAGRPRSRAPRSAGPACRPVGAPGGPAPAPALRLPSARRAIGFPEALDFFPVRQPAARPAAEGFPSHRRGAGVSPHGYGPGPTPTPTMGGGRRGRGRGDKETDGRLFVSARLPATRPAWPHRGILDQRNAIARPLRRGAAGHCCWRATGGSGTDFGGLPWPAPPPARRGPRGNPPRALSPDG